MNFDVSYIWSNFFCKGKYRLLILIITFVISFVLINLFPEFLNKRLFALLNIKSYHFYELMNFFSAGAILTHFSMKKKLLIGISFAALIISIYFNQFEICKFFVLPILVISFGVSSFPYINSVGDKIGDVSYRVYIYGWPIQQFLILFF